MAAAQTIDYGMASGLGKGVESADGYRVRQRVRLTAKEIEPIRYIFSEWDGDAGLGSSAAQLERLAAMPTLLAKGVITEERGAQLIDRAVESAWRKAWERDGQVMTAHGSAAAFRDTYSAIERWTDKMFRRADGVPRSRSPQRTDHYVYVRQCMAAMSTLTRLRRAAPVVLHALYGSKPPGLLSEAPWPKDVNTEYVRVLRFVDGAPSVPELESALRAEKKRAGETEAQWRSRRPSAEATRWAILDGLGRKCEALIEAATVDYRSAWDRSQ